MHAARNIPVATSLTGGLTRPVACYNHLHIRFPPVWRGHMELEAKEIREQLERLLANPLFKHSKRYPVLLRHVVEKTLEGEAGMLKERNLGVDVFGREGDYDTNADPVVRTTAAEIRKRIAQYYHEPGHEHELRIDLPLGSYVPEFHPPPGDSVPPPAGQEIPKRSRTRRLFPGAAFFLPALAVVVLSLVLLGPRLWKPSAAIDRFWEPVVSSPSPVLLCVGQRRFVATQPEPPEDANPDLPRVAASVAAHAPVSLFELYFMGSQNVALPDVVALTGIAGWLQSRGKTCHIRGKSSTTFEDLRNGPVILVGAFNNNWTIRLTGQLRFWFERDNDQFFIKDRQKPDNKDRCVSYSMPYLQLTEDYALISRVWDPTTERLVVVVGGLTGYGTMAAGEFLTDPEYLEALASHIPRSKTRSWKLYGFDFHSAWSMSPWPSTFLSSSR